MDSSHNRYKADLFNYQTILDQNELPPSLHCLSATTKMLLLSVLDPIAWKTRYIGNADQATISEWREQAMVQLILDSCGDNLCELIASAIDDCDLVQQSIINLAGQQGWSSTTGDVNNVLDISIRAKNLLPDDYTCDDDHRFGMAVGLVEYIHGATLEVFQAFENATNQLELAAEVADNVPFWELAASGADVALWVQDTVYELYIAAWSDTVRDEIACELWCAMADTGSCYLSLDTIFNVYRDDALSNPPDVTAIATVWLQWLFGLPLSVDKLIVKVGSLLGLLAIRYGGNFGLFALGIRTLETTVKLLADDTNEDWDILCAECPDPGCDIEFDFEGVGDPDLVFGTITTTKPHNGAKSLEGEAFDGPQEPTPYPGYRTSYRAELGCMFNSISVWVWVQHGYHTGGLSTHVKVYDAADNLIDEVDVVNTGVREQWREDITSVDIGGSYAIITHQFTVQSAGDQSLWIDDVTIS